MRAIDGDVLRDRLQNLGYDDWNQGTTTTWAEAFNECADMVDEQPTIEPQQRWMPCSKEMPKEDGDYLVTLANGVTKILGYSTTQRTTYPKGFYYVKDGFSWRQTQNPVIAWMPKPEPYKEGGAV